MSILTIDHISKYYNLDGTNQERALNDVTLEIAPNSGCVREAKAEVTNLPGLVIGPPTEFVHPALPLKVMDG